MVLKGAGYSQLVCLFRRCPQLTSKYSNKYFNNFAEVGTYSATFSSTPTQLPSQATLFQQFYKLLNEYKQLSKAKLSLLVVSTACAGFVVGSGEEIRWGKLGWTALGTFGAAACANTLNQLYEIKRDAIMRRTMKRPLPSRRISPLHALLFAAVMGTGGLSILYSQVNELTAGLGLTNIVLYAGIYTPLKVVTVANTWIGAVVGAIPPVMGWTAACNRIDPAALVPAMILFFWQIPHFIALAWMAREDYAIAGYKMLTTVEGCKLKPGPVCLRNSFYLLPLGLAAAAMGLTSRWFVLSNGVFSLMLAYKAFKFYMKPGINNARLLFKGSLMVLPLSMTALMVHRIPNEGQLTWGAMLDQCDALVPQDQSIQLRVNLKQIYSLIGSYFVECPSKVMCDEDDQKGGKKKQDGKQQD
eukprot:TRINITY_DN2395_c0_g1_i3.p1 TRINITY_DN2395_c0_g1~~TRINITY_DN2395_c0_g1_i3.p1  ORF type:complete len:414 (+),score=40.51 TRINITY_DN2395_c0_g1_i3:115-1356(+)